MQHDTAQIPQHIASMIDRIQDVLQEAYEAASEKLGSTDIVLLLEVRGEECSISGLTRKDFIESVQDTLDVSELSVRAPQVFEDTSGRGFWVFVEWPEGEDTSYCTIAFRYDVPKEYLN